MATIEKALEIAAQAHSGQVDRQGQPYILHPLRVLMGVEGVTAKIVAVLHDVIEDTHLTLDDLRKAGFSPEVIEGVDRVTHKAGQSYADYVINCRSNDVTRQVKLADLRDNAHLSRLLLRPDRLARDSARMHRYVLSYRYLSDEIDETQYRQAMAAFED